MSDDRQEPPAGGPDESTRSWSDPGDATEPADRTQRLPHPEDRPAGDETRALPADRTAPLDSTAPLPPAGGPPAWSGRAGVPPPRPSEYRETTDWYAEDQGGRRWWSPILWGVVILLLLGALGTGLWLALNAGDDEPTGPEPSPSAPVTRASPTTGAATTSAAPTSASPSASPTEEPGGVPMPPVVNLPLATARAILDRAGLDYRVEYRASDRPAGTVIDTEPDVGELVPEGAEVTLTVSRPETSPDGPEATPSPEPTPTP
ncbi:PASTA domain-containing protein [Micromonospora sp. NPDC126480]|uniref:PASTA domain-containing protein n=1 Tax=Micromonospora sp. NPDC126480 TaxID=3155312 RepID=UPI00332A83FF